MLLGKQPGEIYSDNSTFFFFFGLLSKVIGTELYVQYLIMIFYSQN